MVGWLLTCLRRFFATAPDCRYSVFTNIHFQFNEMWRFYCTEKIYFFEDEYFYFQSNICIEFILRDHLHVSQWIYSHSHATQVASDISISRYAIIISNSKKYIVCNQSNLHLCTVQILIALVGWIILAQPGQRFALDTGLFKARQAGAQKIWDPRWWWWWHVALTWNTIKIQSQPRPRLLLTIRYNLDYWLNLDRSPAHEYLLKHAH